MKRFFSCLALSFFVAAISSTAFAQVQVGFRGGANFGIVSTPSVLDGLSSTIKPSPGFTGALFLEVPLSDRISFRPELAYVQKGFMVRESFDLNLSVINLPIGASVAYQSQDLEVPLLLKFNLTDGAVQPYFIAGPAVSYAVNGRIRTRGTGLFRTQPIDIDLNYGGALNRWDISGVVGAGLAFDAGAGKVFGEVRYQHGFSRQVQVPVLNLNVRNRGVAVSLGYSFPIGN
ncbi:MAG: PorT family protein [Bacteroidetes bacterium]|nr:PorT family protein [Fibrella sp.]